MLKTIDKELKLAKYYSISVDSTPDVSQVDQLTFIVRYVKGNPITTIMFNTILHLKTLTISIKGCCGQNYDNAENYSGFQTQMEEKCDLQFLSHVPYIS